jgi:hypothetical protein
MGNAKFFYYPEPNGSHLVTIDIGEALGEMFSDMIVDVVDGVSLTGSISRSVGLMTETVTIQRDRMILGEDLAYQFEALQNHLDRGYSVGFTADDDYSYCFPLLGTHQSGVFEVKVGRPPFLNMLGTGNNPSISVGDYLTIETSSPNQIRERVKVTNVDSMSPTGLGGTFEIDKRLCFEYTRPAFARHSRFFPVLKRPSNSVGQNIITNESGRLFNLNVTLVVDYETLFAFHPNTISEDGVSLGRGLGGTPPTAGNLPTGFGRFAGLDGMARGFRDMAENGQLADTGGQPPDFIWDN